MTGPQIITSLRSMHLAVEDKSARYREYLAEMTALSVHFSAVIAYMESGSAHSARSEPTASVAHSFERGQCFARIQQILRDHGPVLSTPELVTHCLKHANIDLNSKLLREDMHRKVLSLIKRQEPKGTIVAAGKQGKKIKLWRLPE